jgi:hypothetical protein
LTFPDLDAELDRMFPGWRTWREVVPRRKEEEKTMEDRFREFIEEHREEKENV